MKEDAIKIPAVISETELHGSEFHIIELRNEMAELKSREAKYLETIQEQSQELDQLRKLARVVLTHFEGFLNTGYHADRCMGCSKCDYEILGQALLPFKDMADKQI